MTDKCEYGKDYEEKLLHYIDIPYFKNNPSYIEQWRRYYLFHKDPQILLLMYYKGISVYYHWIYIELAKHFMKLQKVEIAHFILNHAIKTNVYQRKKLEEAINQLPRFEKVYSKYDMYCILHQKNIVALGRTWNSYNELYVYKNYNKEGFINFELMKLEEYLGIDRSETKNNCNKNIIDNSNYIKSEWDDFLFLAKYKRKDVNVDYRIFDFDDKEKTLEDNFCENITKYKNIKDNTINENFNLDNDRKSVNTNEYAHNTNINTNEELHNTNINTNEYAHNTNEYAHNTNINTNEYAHNTNINTNEDAHNTNINTNEYAHNTNINTNEYAHNTNINTNEDAHNTNINTNEELHNTNINTNEDAYNKIASDKEDYKDKTKIKADDKTINRENMWKVSEKTFIKKDMFLNFDKNKFKFDQQEINDLIESGNYKIYRIDGELELNREIIINEYIHLIQEIGDTYYISLRIAKEADITETILGKTFCLKKIRYDELFMLNEVNESEFCINNQLELFTIFECDRLDSLENVLITCDAITAGYYLNKVLEIHKMYLDKGFVLNEFVFWVDLQFNVFLMDFDIQKKNDSTFEKMLCNLNALFDKFGYFINKQSIIYLSEKITEILKTTENRKKLLKHKTDILNRI